MYRQRTGMVIRVLAISITLAVFLGFLPGVAVSSSADIRVPEVPGFPHVKRVSDTSLEVSWNKVNRASGYEVYRYSKVMKKYVLAKSIRGSSSVKWRDKRLKKNTKYSYKVRAWRTDSGSKEYSGFTYAVSALTYKKDATTVNAGTKFKGGRSMTIGLGQKLQLNASVTPSLLSKAKKKKVVDKSVRILVSDQNLVQKVDGKTIVGRQVGLTNVYALAHNGNIKKISITVIDYAKPNEWKNLGQMPPEMVTLFTNQHANLTDVVSWLSQHNDIEGELKLSKDGILMNESDIILNDRQEAVVKLLKQQEHYSMVIGVWQGGITIDLASEAEGIYIIYFNIQVDYDEDEYNNIYHGLKLADHWMFNKFLPV